MEVLTKLIDLFAQHGGFPGLVIIVLFILILFVLKGSAAERKAAAGDRTFMWNKVDAVVSSHKEIAGTYAAAIKEQATATQHLTLEQQKLNMHIENILQELVNKNIRI
jgi:Na+-transporting methylmalonyl-CoA/oxaloacetate decarboxylase gamma subunit